MTTFPQQGTLNSHSDSLVFLAIKGVLWFLREGKKIIYS